MIPSKIRVRLLSEAAGYITFSHVVQRDFSMTELVEILLPVLGTDAGRIRQILQNVETSAFPKRSLQMGL